MPKINNSANKNSNSNVDWYVKLTSDTIDFVKGIPVNVLADPDNVKVFDNYVKIKSGGLNMIIPMVDVAGGRKAWDEAIARGAGDVVQDLAVSALASTAYAIAIGSNPVGWGAVFVGGAVLGITWATSANDISFGAFLEKEIANLKNNQFNGVVDNMATIPVDYTNHIFGDDLPSGNYYFLYDYNNKNYGTDYDPSFLDYLNSMQQWEDFFKNNNDKNDTGSVCTNCNICVKSCPTDAIKIQTALSV